MSEHDHDQIETELLGELDRVGELTEQFNALAAGMPPTCCVDEAMDLVLKAVDADAGISPIQVMAASAVLQANHYALIREPLLQSVHESLHEAQAAAMDLQDTMTGDQE